MKKVVYLLLALVCLAGSLLTLNSLKAEAKTERLINGLGLYDFGNVVDEKTVIFTIENQGREVLKLTGTPTVQLSNTRDFKVIDQPSVTSLEPGQLTNFKVTFYATNQGVKSARVVVPTNDRDERKYSFVITAKGMPLRPEMQVVAGKTELIEGDRYYSGSTAREAVTTFTIENVGDGILNLTNSPVVEMNDYRFKVVKQPAHKHLLPGEGTTFEVRFYVLNRGYQSGNVTIHTDDPAHPDYKFIISATGVPEDKDVNIVAIARDWQTA